MKNKTVQYTSIASLILFLAFAILSGIKELKTIHWIFIASATIALVSSFLKKDDQ